MEYPQCSAASCRIDRRAPGEAMSTGLDVSDEARSMRHAPSTMRHAPRGHARCLEPQALVRTNALDHRTAEVKSLLPETDVIGRYLRATTPPPPSAPPNATQQNATQTLTQTLPGRRASTSRGHRQRNYS